MSCCDEFIHEGGEYSAQDFLAEFVVRAHRVLVGAGEGVGRRNRRMQFTIGTGGARVERCTAAEHDAAVAMVSHLPYLVASALARAAREAGPLALKLAGDLSSPAIVMQSYVPMAALLAWWWLDMAHFRPWGVLQRIGLAERPQALAAARIGGGVDEWTLRVPSAAAGTAQLEATQADAEFARQSLAMKDGQLIGRTSQRPVQDYLRRHGGLASEQVPTMVKTLERVLGEVGGRP